MSVTENQNTLGIAPKDAGGGGGGAGRGDPGTHRSDGPTHAHGLVPGETHHTVICKKGAGRGGRCVNLDRRVLSTNKTREEPRSPQRCQFFINYTKKLFRLHFRSKMP